MTIASVVIGDARAVDATGDKAAAAGAAVVADAGSREEDSLGALAFALAVDVAFAFAFFAFAFALSVDAAFTRGVAFALAFTGGVAFAFTGGHAAAAAGERGRNREHDDEFAPIFRCYPRSSTPHAVGYAARGGKENMSQSVTGRSAAGMLVVVITASSAGGCPGRSPPVDDEPPPTAAEGEGEGESEGEGEGEGDAGEGEGEGVVVNPCATLDTFDADDVYIYGTHGLAPYRVIGALDGGGYATGFPDGAGFSAALRDDGALVYAAVEGNGDYVLRVFAPDTDVFADNGDGVASRADCRYPGRPGDNDATISLPAACTAPFGFPQRILLVPGQPGRFVVDCRGAVDEAGTDLSGRRRLDVVAMDDGGRLLFAGDEEVAFADSIDPEDFVDIGGRYAAARGTVSGFLVAAVTEVDEDGGGPATLLAVGLDGGVTSLGDYPPDLWLYEGERLALDGEGRLYRVIRDDVGSGVARATVGAATTEVLRPPHPLGTEFTLVTR